MKFCKSKIWWILWCERAVGKSKTLIGWSVGCLTTNQHRFGQVATTRLVDAIIKTSRIFKSWLEARKSMYTSFQFPWRFNHSGSSTCPKLDLAKNKNVKALFDVSNIFSRFLADSDGLWEREWKTFLVKNHFDVRFFFFWGSIYRRKSCQMFTCLEISLKSRRWAFFTLKLWQIINVVSFGKAMRMRIGLNDLLYAWHIFVRFKLESSSSMCETVQSTNDVDEPLKI